jgi:hypothetical protein
VAERARAHVLFVWSKVITRGPVWPLYGQSTALDSFQQPPPCGVTKGRAKLAVVSSTGGPVCADQDVDGKVTTFEPWEGKGKLSVVATDDSVREPKHGWRDASRPLAAQGLPRRAKDLTESPWCAVSSSATGAFELAGTAACASLRVSRKPRKGVCNCRF